MGSEATPRKSRDDRNARPTGNAFMPRVARRLDLPGYEARTAEDPLVTWVEVGSLFALIELLQDHRTSPAFRKGSSSLSDGVPLLAQPT